MAKRGQALRRARAAKKPAKPAVDLKQENAGLKRELAQALERQAATSEENTRLIVELREALNRQTATADVLKLISRSTFDLQPVLDTLVETAARLCNAEQGTVWRQDGDVFGAIGSYGHSEEARRFLNESHPGPGRGTLVGRTVLQGRIVHILDACQDPEYTWSEAVERVGFRTMLGVPLLRDGIPIGAFSLYRNRVHPFSDKQIDLVATFADQAVIAIENVRLLTETREALEQQTATAEVLQVINSSPGDLRPVFAAVLDKATRLCDFAFSILWTYDGEAFRAVAMHGVPPRYAAYLAARAIVPPPNTEGAFWQFIAGRDFIHIDDVAATPLEQLTPRARGAVEIGGARTNMLVALRKDGRLLGAIEAYRTEVRAFSEKQIALLQNFAAQAVIAMENARLVTETREALEQQTATAEVLQVINSSPGDLMPVFDAMLEKATELCGAKFGCLFLHDGNAFTVAAVRNLPPAYARVVRGQSFSAETNTGLRRLVESKASVHIRDLLADPTYAEREPLRTAAAELGGVRSLVAVPLRKKGELIGGFTIYRHEPGGFAENQIALVTTFADQAVIAIENARLFGELRQRTTDLARSVDELTATGDVLKIISRSSVDLETVLDTLVETVARLCRADQANMFRRRDDTYHLVASRGLSREAKDFLLAHPLAADRSTLSGRVTLERRPIHIPDVLQDPEYNYQGQKIIGFRTMLGVPLLRENALIGVFSINRTRVEPFTDKEIALANTFADQAVIAIENARLFDELRERQAELRVTFDNMGDGVAMFDGQQRLAAWNSNFQHILDMPDALLARRLTYADYLRILAERGEFGTEDVEAELNRRLQDTERELRLERTRPDGRVIEVRRNAVPGGGFVLIYSDITERKRAEEAIRAARDAAETALRELQTAQASLVHAQKMAALGQLTAGIAHEIKNPLNFVNNFAGLSVELLDELKETAAQAMGALGADKRAEFVDTIGMLTGNLEKIAEHGRRADGIVKSMLQHSRGGSGEQQATDLNVLVEEALNLAYHGARAQDQSFNITLERDLAPNLAPIEVVPQDVMRVFLNLIGNGFYAANKRSREGEGTFRPVLKITTREAGEAVEIRVRDNGVGIAAEHREKLFQPFFTTKPTGEGTGLGLSISYEIVTQQHGGTITVDSEVGQFTEFTVRLPRRQHPTAGRAT
jgi:GAF domain-containing protein